MLSPLLSMGSIMAYQTLLLLHTLWYAFAPYLRSLEAVTFKHTEILTQSIGICVAQFFAGAVSSAFLLIATPKFGLTGVWAGLVLFMSLRAAAGFWR